MAKRTLLLFISLAVLTGLALFLPPGGPGVSANDGDDDTPNIPERRELTYPNLGSHLDAVVAGYEGGRQSQRQAAEQGEVNQNGSIAVTLHLSGNVAAVEDYLDDNGASVRNVGADYIEAYVPVSLLGQASQQSGVTRIREIIPPQPMYGTVTSQGVNLHLDPAWHNNGFRGGGVKVGIIDLGFTGLQSLMGTELTSNIVGRCYTDVGVYSSNLADCDVPNRSVHGAAVAEAVIDVAPEVTLYVANPYSYADDTTTVAWMASEGVQVINASLGWFFDGPGDGTSPYTNSPLKNVDRAVASGMIWLNSAGNAARDTWFGAFADSDNDTFHQWSGTDESQTLSFETGDVIYIQLRWDDQWGGSSKDLDLYFTTGPDNTVVASSTDRQLGGSDDEPFEWTALRIPADGEYDILVKQHSGAAPGWLQLTVWARSIPSIEHYTESGSITNPAESANPGLMAVGATPYWDVNTTSYYSSQGPAPDGRTKPDIVGVDCAESISYPKYTTRSGRDIWFCGTSQSSPHLAGLAALVKQANPSFTPAQTANFLKRNAEPRGDASPNSPDNVWGSGFAKLREAPAATCHRQLTADVGTIGTWNNTCVSQVASPDPDDAGDARSYARYYTITLAESQEVSITLESGDTPKVDTFLYLRQGEDTRSGPAVAENDDIDRNAGIYDSRITRTLAAGSYTIEATTYYAGAAGSFTLTIESPDGGDGGTPAYVCVKTFTADGDTDGTWDDTCLSQVEGRGYARYYTFTLSEQQEVTITLESATDTYLYLRQGEDNRSGPVEAENDDIETGVNLNSRIKETLAAGSYTIEATTYAATYPDDQDLDFALSVSGLSGGASTDCQLNQTLTPGDSCTGQDFTATVESNGDLSLRFTGTAAPPAGLSFARTDNYWTVNGLP